MKKQLLIAATAATMSVSALADISITGAASATWTHTDFDAAGTANTNVYAQDFDITITGTSGATTATVSLDIEDTDSVVAGEVKLTTSLMGIDLTITDDSCTAGVSGCGNAGENVEFIASTEIAGVTLTFEDSNSSSNGAVSGSIDVADATVTVKKAETSTKTTVEGDLGGITGKYVNFSSTTASADYATVEVSGSALNSTVTVTHHSGESATAAFLDLDGDAGAALESSDANVLKLVTDINGNSVTLESIDANLNGAQTVDKRKISATRALESGADLTATYTDDNYSSKSSVALKIAVSF